MSTDLAIDEAVRAYLSVGRKYYSTDSSVRDAARSMPFYLNGRARHRKLILQWLEESYDSKEPVAPESLTIEHVLPQTPTTEWRQALAADLGSEENFREAHEALVHTLGNLTLTGYNSELSNSSFAVKRIQLAKSGIVLNQEIAAQECWGRPDIHARADALADRIVSLWPGPSSQATDQSDVPWNVMTKVLAELPAGSWTTYGDLAALIGNHPVPVGARIAPHPVPNAHRVLQVEGTVSPGFRWLDPDRTDDPRGLLRAEGVEFDQYRTDQAQRIGTEDLAQLAGLTPDEMRYVGPATSSRSCPRQRTARRRQRPLRPHAGSFRSRTTRSADSELRMHGLRRRKAGAASAAARSPAIRVRSRGKTGTTLIERSG